MPGGYKPNKALGVWVAMQRQAYKKKGKRGGITEERMKRLNSIGFEWVIRQQACKSKEKAAHAPVAEERADKGEEETGPSSEEEEYGIVAV